jgi:hypothetical protein
MLFLTLTVSAHRLKIFDVPAAKSRLIVGAKL